MGLSVLLCDDHGIVREGLRAILAKHGLAVAGEASGGREAIELAAQTRPDIVLMDVSMPGLNGIVATQRLLAEVPATKVLALSMHADRRYVLAMFGAGARGYVMKSSVSEELLEAIHCVSAGRRYVSPAIAGIDLQQRPTAVGTAGQGSDAPVPPSAKALSAREREVLQLIAEGQSSKDIAACLDIALTTVETYRRQIMGKLNLRSIAELTKYALREGLTSLE